jgi:hypothetical protein
MPSIPSNSSTYCDPDKSLELWTEAPVGDARKEM